MKKRSAILAVLLLASVPLAYANTTIASDVKVLEKADIVKLDDEKLVAEYVDTLVEIEAKKSFHTTNGFGPKDYQEFKDLVRYRINLRLEIHARNLEIPAID